jgi:hypothetical protein
MSNSDMGFFKYLSIVAFLTATEGTPSYFVFVVGFLSSNILSKTNIIIFLTKSIFCVPSENWSPNFFIAKFV